MHIVQISKGNLNSCLRVWLQIQMSEFNGCINRFSTFHTYILMVMILMVVPIDFSMTFQKQTKCVWVCV